MVLKCTLYQKRDSIAWITLNRPDVLNALNRDLWREIRENLETAERDEETRAVIITGKGRAFCAGDDIKEVSSFKTVNEIESFFLDFAMPAVGKIVQIPKPVIAAVNGPAYGGGCEIAMLCDLVVASENATFAVPEALIGAIPPVAALIGEYLIGKLNISMMMMTGEPITAQEAKTMGLVNRVVLPEELTMTAEEFANTTMRAAPSSIKTIKKLIYHRFKKEELETTVKELIRIVKSNEGKEGHKAFLEKRPPKWIES